MGSKNLVYDKLLRRYVVAEEHQRVPPLDFGAAPPPGGVIEVGQTFDDRDGVRVPRCAPHGAVRDRQVVVTALTDLMRDVQRLLRAEDYDTYTVARIQSMILEKMKKVRTDG